MKIRLYENLSDSNHLYKEITLKGEIDCNMKDGCDFIDPVIKIKELPAYSFNYIYIPTFDRYYFMIGGATLINGIWECSFHCDVLASNRVEILQQTAVVSRQEFKYNLNLDDGTLKAYSNPITILKMSNISITDYNSYSGSTKVGPGTNVIIIGGSSPSTKADADARKQAIQDVVDTVLGEDTTDG